MPFVEDSKGQTAAVTSCYHRLTSRPFTSESGVVFKPQQDDHNAPALDTLIIPAERDFAFRILRERRRNGLAVALQRHGVSRRSARARLTSSDWFTQWPAGYDALATGARVVKTFPELKVDPNALFLKDGKFYTCAGITAGIDLSLALIEEDFGPR